MNSLIAGGIIISNEILISSSLCTARLPHSFEQDALSTIERLYILASVREDDLSDGMNIQLKAGGMVVSLALIMGG